MSTWKGTDRVCCSGCCWGVDLTCGVGSSEPQPSAETNQTYEWAPEEATEFDVSHVFSSSSGRAEP
ncbi:MAG: hypothetical protein H6718_00200 [Polyangiaceae bacterium]|nr:hypothetical protein [Polyangiaceae bacterium]